MWVTSLITTQGYGQGGGTSLQYVGAWRRMKHTSLGSWAEHQLSWTVLQFTLADCPVPSKQTYRISIYFIKCGHFWKAQIFWQGLVGFTIIVRWSLGLNLFLRGSGTAVMSMSVVSYTWMFRPDLAVFSSWFKEHTPVCTLPLFYVPRVTT